MFRLSCVPFLIKMGRRGAMTTISESVVEEAALKWLMGLGWQVAQGPDIAPQAGHLQDSLRGEKNK